MGRHSAPDDDDTRSAVVVRPTGDRRPRPGRHARPDDDDESPIGRVLQTMPRPSPPVAAPDQVTARIAPSVPSTPDVSRAPEVSRVPEPALGTTEDTEPIVPTDEAEEEQVDASPAATARVGKGNQSTAADLALLREHSDVRARVIASVVVPFVLYTAVLYAIGALDVYFIWVWIPLVTAGVVAGSILDAAHRRRGHSPL